MLAHDIVGDGPPLVLLHFLGANRHVWRPVLPRLAESRQVISVDLPGFGDSRALVGSPTVPRLAQAVAGLFEELGLVRPAIAGISLGGGIAVELSAQNVAGPVVAISPLGFATRPEAAFAKASLRATQAACRALAGQVDRLSGPTVLRTAFGAQIFGKPWAVPPQDLAALVRSVATSPGMLPTLRVAIDYQAGGTVSTAPVTIAWGQRDALLVPRQGVRAIERLPFAKLVPLPGCGHVPLWDSPERVSDVILEGTAA